MTVVLSYQDPAPPALHTPPGPSKGGTRLEKHEGKVLQFLIHPTFGLCAVLLDSKRKQVTMRSLTECHFVREESGVAPSGPLI